MNGQVEPPNDGMTPAQRADLASLLTENLLPRNIQWLAERVLGVKAISDLTGNKPPAGVLASSLVERMHQAAGLAEAVAILKTETRNRNLLQGLNHILSGKPLADFAALEATVHAPEDPFFSNDFIELYYPRVQRTVCAIGLGPPVNRLMGTGFLIAPNLVMTNFHVVDPFLTVQNENGEDKITAAQPGDQIFFFFDYLSAPRPVVPPDIARPHASMLVRAVRENWLRRARCRLSNEGRYPYAQNAHNKFDYAVIELEKPVGTVPSRRSGGSLRGWLSLNSGVSFFDDVGSRLVVLQHPEGAEQLFDVGVYSEMDPSQTRIWYQVNTQRGASGGPAVDRKGRLYALHNASVFGENDVQRDVNQGVRIDLILKDIEQDPAIVIPPPIDENVGYWSLSENPSDPQPIVGRQHFRDSVARMTPPNGGRILAVTGPKDSGRKFSVEMLKRIVDANVPVIQFSPDDLSTLSPTAFVKALASELALPNAATIPDPKPTESVSRSLSFDLPTWLAQHLAADQARNPSRYPVWIVLNTIMPEGKRLIWAENLPDLISALMGPLDMAQPTPELPQLRWLLLGAPNSVFPPTRTPSIVDDLSAQANTDFAVDFANCLTLGWRSIDRTASMTPDLLKNMGTAFYNDATRDNKPVRAHLAFWVRRFILGQ